MDFMRTLATTSLMVVALCGCAVAADMQPPIPYLPQSMPEMAGWTGFYVGVNAGGGFGTAKNDFSIAGAPSFATVDLPQKGAIGGGQIGYNWQAGPAVFGIEADLQASSIKGSVSTPPLPLSANYSQELPWFGTARGRIGYAQAGWLLYATGGYAYGRVKTVASATAGPATVSVTTNENGNGWTVGSGAEVMIAPRWSIKVEYLYVDLGTTTISYAFPALPTLNNNTHVTINVARAGLNFRF